MYGAKIPKDREQTTISESAKGHPVCRIKRACVNQSNMRRGQITEIYRIVLLVVLAPLNVFCNYNSYALANFRRYFEYCFT